jgi:hypothetical protein
MGGVYLAEDEALARRVAIKMISRELATLAPLRGARKEIPVHWKGVD